MRCTPLSLTAIAGVPAIMQGRIICRAVPDDHDRLSVIWSGTGFVYQWPFRHARSCDGFVRDHHAADIPSTDADIPTITPFTTVRAGPRIPNKRSRQLRASDVERLLSHNSCRAAGGIVSTTSALAFSVCCPAADGQIRLCPSTCGAASTLVQRFNLELMS